MAVWIRGGNVVNPAKGFLEKADVFIEKKRIVELSPHGALKEAVSRVKIIDATGKFIFPGLIDMHVHLREPGYEHKETIETGGRAAVAGGFTALAPMPNTAPPNDSESVTGFMLEQAERAGLVRLYPIACITAGQKGERLTDFGKLRKAGARGVSDDGFPVVNSQLMRKALEEAKDHGLLVSSHCEDPYLSGRGVMHEGEVSAKMNLPGIPACSEEIMVYRDISLARLTGCPVHIAHVSTAGSVELIKRAKSDGVPVTAETTPHYFTLDHRAVMEYSTKAKVNPPLRSEEDVEAIKEGLAQGVIDVIATDHAPHSPLEKDLDFEKAAFGMIGVQTALPLTLELVRQGVLDLPEAVRKLSYNPARLLGAPGGCLVKDCEADLVLIDPEHEYVLREEDILSKSKNSPFIGWRLKGANQLTMIGGRIVWERDA